MIWVVVIIIYASIVTEINSIEWKEELNLSLPNLYLPWPVLSFFWFYCIVDLIRDNNKININIHTYKKTKQRNIT
jgi:hypothetical protein